jgi:RNA-directed DNA polymerase
MRRKNNLIVQVADIDNLRLAFWKASKGKRHSEAVLSYQKQVEQHLLVLRRQILLGDVSVGNYHSFKVYDPKERIICAAEFAEQVLHHALMNVCHEDFEQKQIYTSCASRKHKGTSFAIRQAQKYTRKYAYFLKLDVRKFFDSIDQHILKQQIQAMYKDTRLCFIFGEIIDSYSTQQGKGVPIGNLTSQYFANHYLAGLDHYIKEQLLCKAYIRYMDDMLLFASDKTTLQTMHKQIVDYTGTKLKLELKPPTLRKTSTGVPFLGYLVLPTHLRLLQKSKKRFFKKFRAIEQALEKQKISEKQYQAKATALFSFAMKAKTKKLREKMLAKQNVLSL